MAQQRVYVFLGMIASGKSTLARLWAEREGLACYNSDVVRKQLAGSEPEADCQDDFGRGIYTPEMTRRTYDALLDYAGREFEQGRSVVLDASYGNVDERNRVVTLATEAGVAVKLSSVIAMMMKLPAGLSCGHRTPPRFLMGPGRCF